MDDITEADYMHTKRIYKDFEIRNLVEYHDLHLKCETLRLADVFENLRKMCLEIYQLDLSVPGFLFFSIKIEYNLHTNKKEYNIYIYIYIYMYIYYILYIYV